MLKCFSDCGWRLGGNVGFQHLNGVLASETLNKTDEFVKPVGGDVVLGIGYFITLQCEQTPRRIGYGATDQTGRRAVENPCYSYELHATALHLLGLDHTRLTYYHNGVQRRLTDVHGHVVREILDI